MMALRKVSNALRIMARSMKPVTLASASLIAVTVALTLPALADDDEIASPLRDEPLAACEDLARHNSSPAMLELALRYEGRDGVAANPALARSWLMKAASAGNKYGEWVLGHYLRNGSGGDKKPGDAMHWIRRAADHGLASAQNELGDIFCDQWEGNAQNGLPRRDYKQAIKWYRLAAVQGHSDACISLGRIYWEGRGVARDHTASMKWFKKGAALGGASAMYLVGLNIESDEPSEAANWYRQAAAKGEANAMRSLGELYGQGKGVRQDDSTALTWYLKAASAGDSYAPIEVAEMYETGKTLQNPVEALKWYLKSTESGAIPSVAYKLGIMYETGTGAPEDYVAAYMWYELAAAKGNNEAMRAKALLRKVMTPEQIAEAQARAAAWKPVEKPAQVTK
jgi:TPR repeat protein